MAKKGSQSCITTPYKTTCGGQALIEGIMMQGPERRAVVVRKPDGELEVTTWDIQPRKSLWRPSSEGSRPSVRPCTTASRP